MSPVFVGSFFLVLHQSICVSEVNRMVDDAANIIIFFVVIVDFLWFFISSIFVELTRKYMNVLIRDAINIVEVCARRPVLIILIDRIHFAENPEVGGNLLKLATQVSDTVLFDCEVLLIDFCFSMSFIIKITADQYKIENVNITMNLNCLLETSHPLLKTDERAIISIVILLFSNSIEVRVTQEITNSHKVLFKVKVKIISGIDFCQVIKTIDLTVLIVLIISTNQR
jgi:hypothetical protein